MLANLRGGLRRKNSFYLHWSILRFWDISQRIQEKYTMCLFSYIFQLKYTSLTTAFTTMVLSYSRPTNLHFSSNLIQQFCFFTTLYILKVLMIMFAAQFTEHFILNNQFSGWWLVTVICVFNQNFRKNATQKKVLPYCPIVWNQLGEFHVDI